MLLTELLNAVPKGDFKEELDESRLGLTLQSLISIPIEYSFYKYIDKWIDLSQCLVVDSETYALNSRIRLLVAFDVAAAKVYVFLKGCVKQGDDIKLKEELAKYGLELELYLFEYEADLLNAFLDFIIMQQKILIGHNLAHFDLGLITAKMAQYGINKVKFYSYNTGSGMEEKRQFYSYEVKDSEEKTNLEERKLIVDTLAMAFTLKIPANLEALSKNTQFSKKKLDYRAFENDELGFEELSYAIFDTLSIPEVYKYIKNIIILPADKMTAVLKASQLTNEHLWMKGSGALAEAYLNQLLGRINPNVPDYLTQYLGGLTRTWIIKEIFLPEGDKKLIEGDLTQAYTFSIAKQGILDILNGDFKYIQNESSISKIKEYYSDLIFSSVLDIKAKQRCWVLVEVERHKDKNERKSEKNEITLEGESNNFGIAYIRSFEKDEKIQEIQHDFAWILVERGEVLRLTKTAYEMNKALNPNFEDEVMIYQIYTGLIPMKFEKSQEYLKLYEIRQQLKREGNPAHNGIKTLILSVYGKIAQTTGQWFNLACAAAVTGFVRYQLFATVLYARSLGAIVIQSDTDSLYLKCSEQVFKKIQDFADKLNQLPLQYGERNLKREDRDKELIAFMGQKRKRYVKVYRDPKTGRNIAHITGLSGNRDIAWKDALFRLCAMTDPIDENNKYSLEVLNQKFQKSEFLPEPMIDLAMFEALAKEVYTKYLNRKISEILPVDNDSIISNKIYVHLKTKACYEEGSAYYYYVKAWENYVNENILDFIPQAEREKYRQAKAIVDEIIILEQKLKLLNEQLEFFEREIKEFEKVKNSGWGQFADLILSHLGRDYGESIFDSSAHTEFRYYFKKFAEALGLEYKYHTSDFYLNLFEYLRDYGYDKEKVIAVINSIAPKAIKLDVDDKKIGCWRDEIERLREQINDLELELEAKKNKEFEKAQKLINSYKIKPYVGLFFEVNRDYTFRDKTPDEVDYSLNYEVYKMRPDYSPVLRCSDYMQLLLLDLSVDSIFLRTESSLPVSEWNIPSEMQRKRLSKALYQLGHRSRVREPRLSNLPALVITAKISQYPNPIDGLYDIQICTKESDRNLLKNKNLRDVYHNASLYVVPQQVIDFGIHVHKIGLHVKSRDIFELYRFFDAIGRSIRKKFEDLLAAQGVILKIPRFTVSNQIDISQPSDENFARELYNRLYDSNLLFASIGSYTRVAVLSYFDFTCYNKKKNANWKLENELLEDYERDYFEEEAKEGWRSEIKFSLNRHITQTLSYAYLLALIDQKGFIQLLDPAKRFSEKKLSIKLPAKVIGKFKFSEKKAVVLFASKVLVKTEILLKTQDYQIKGKAENLKEYNDLMSWLLEVLDFRGVFSAKPPPQIIQNQKFPDLKIYEVEESSEVDWSINPKYLNLNEEVDRIKEIWRL